MTEETHVDPRPIAERLRAAGNGQPYQLHWLCDAAAEIDRLGLALRMIAEAAPDSWSRELAANALKGRQTQLVSP